MPAPLTLSTTLLAMQAAYTVAVGCEAVMMVVVGTISVGAIVAVEDTVIVLVT